MQRCRKLLLWFWIYQKAGNFLYPAHFDPFLPNGYLPSQPIICRFPNGANLNRPPNR